MFERQSDLALLELQEPFPSETHPAYHCSVKSPATARQQFIAFGYPEDYQFGVWTSGTILSETLPNGWLQLLVTDGPALRPGFSGSPVWHASRGCMLGLVVASRQQEGVAFAIPMDVIQTFLPDDIWFRFPRVPVHAKPVSHPATPSLVDLAREILYRFEDGSHDGFQYGRLDATVPLRVSQNEALILDLDPGLIDYLSGDTYRRPALLLGEYGQGKTVTSGIVNAALATRFLREPDRAYFPFLIPLRCITKLSNLEVELLALLWKLYRYDLSEQDMERVLSEGRLLFILDGLDEFIAQSGQDDISMSLEHLCRLTTTRGNRLLLTTRPNVFRNLEQLTRLKSNFETFSLEPLGLRDVEKYMEQVGAADIMEPLINSPGSILKDLASRPLYLQMLAASATEIEAASQWRR